MDVSEYLQFRDRVDKNVDVLHALHTSHLKCSRGCDLCCVDFSVFPVEFYAIRQQVEKEYPQVLQPGFLPGQEEGRCKFLKEKDCSIYNARPTICRTHGYPLLNMNEAGDDWELSFCELNFNEADEEYFHEENVWMQDTANSELFVINRNFIKHNCLIGCNERTLMPLSQLME